MQVYETTFIVNPQLDDSAIDQKVNAVLDLIKNHGGKIVHTDHMGTRRLAYEIRGLNQGYYGSFIYEAQREFPATLERYFKLEETYLRNLTVCYEGDLEKLKESKSEDAFGASEEKAGNRGSSKPAPARPRPEPAAAPPAAAPPAAVEESPPGKDDSEVDDKEKTDEIILDHQETAAEDKKAENPEEEEL